MPLNLYFFERNPSAIFLDFPSLSDLSYCKYKFIRQENIHNYRIEKIRKLNIATSCTFHYSFFFTIYTGTTEY